jgi:Right handed beta helix region/Pectate lyase superfamily protein
MRQLLVPLVLLITACGLLLAFGQNSPPTPSEPKSLRDFGAAGDGRADDDAAIQKAVDSRQGSVHVPKGVYRITRPIVVDLDKTGFTSFTADGTARLVMAGAGPALRFIGTHTKGTAEPKSVPPGVWANERMPVVEGLEIVGDHPEADGIEANGTMKLTVSRVAIRACRHGIHLIGRNRNVVVADCHIYHNRGIGVFYDDVNLHQSNIVGCHISYCAGGGVVSRGGEVRNIQIGTCDIESNMSPDGPPTANVLLDCTGGSVAEVAITGCTLQHNSPSPDSANIRIIGLGKDIPRKGQARWGHVTIGDNVLSDVQVNVDIRDSRGVTLSGNTFWMGYAYNLRVEGSQQIVVGPNAFERNPGYAYGTSRETKNSLLFRDCSDCTLSGLHIHNVYKADAGLTLENCRRFNVTGCSVLDCEKVGVLLKDVRDSRLSDCLIRNDLETKESPLALRAIGGSGNMIVNNLLGNPFEVAKETGITAGNSDGKGSPRP